MAGIYIHIPFCRRKCPYCNFFSLATTKFRNDFRMALFREMELTRNYLGNEPVETIYFGGGTPSLLPVERLEKILIKLRDAGYGIAPPPAPPLKRRGEYGFISPDSSSPDHGSRVTDPGFPEITMELNPEDVTPGYLEGLAVTGINRLSLGVQSFFDEDLRYLGRVHDARQIEQSLAMILDKGQGEEIGNWKSEIVNVSVDLIYGIPTLCNEHWKENLRRVIDLGIPHLSAYALTVEPKTPLAWQMERGLRVLGTGNREQECHCEEWSDEARKGNREQGITVRGEKREARSEIRTIRDTGSGIRDTRFDDQAAEQFGILMDVMEEAGYIQYEISNFCLPGYESRHNSNYWRGIPYLGLGPSAHSYNGLSRRWNISHLTSYIRAIQSGNLPVEEETLTLTMKYNEYVLTSLRTIWGCDLEEIRNRFGEAYATYFSLEAIRHLASGRLEETGGTYRLTRNGKYLADGIAAELFYG